LDKHLHIVTHEVPWPANYGGVISLFYKIKSLYETGVKIHLHCFTKEIPTHQILNSYCYSVNYYKRDYSLSIFQFTFPYIVYTRRSKELLLNLEKDKYPILFEGTHCTYWIYKNKLSDRNKTVSLHNIEFEYYKNLYKAEKNIFKKLYFYIESKLLLNFENNIAHKANFWAVSNNDIKIFENQFKSKLIKFFPVFLPWKKLKIELGNGNYCLYHGNLEINENEKAALWLLQNIFFEIKIPFVIAGKNPSATLKKAAYKNKHTCLVENPSEFEMEDLIRKAHINIIPSFNNTGVKIKLLNALFNGRHCIVNQSAVQGSGLEELCIICKDENEFKDNIKKFYEIKFEEIDLLKREKILLELYNNNKNAMTISEMIL
jgi:hypothetical protein